MNKYIIVFLIITLIACLRYLIMTGAYYYIVYKLFDKNLHRFKINPKPANSSSMKYEIKWALLNKLNFGIIGLATYIMYEKGWLKFYYNLDEYGIVYAIVIIPLLLVVLDTYFFWLHYIMHYTKLKNLSHHNIHHGSENVSPWSAFSVHPVEGFFEILLRPIIFLTVPLHPYSLVAFFVITFALNILGHSGYEFFPRSFATSSLTKLKSSATFHYIHHQDGRYNLSLFFNFWDRIMGTYHPGYPQFYADIKEQQKLGNATEVPKLQKILV